MGYYSTKSLLLNGSTQYCGAGDVLGFDRLDACSFSCWVKTSNASFEGMLIAKRGDTTAQTGYMVWFSWERIKFTWTVDNGAGTIVEGHAGSGLADGGWHHVLVTKAAGSALTDFHVYVDNVDETITLVYNALNTGSIITTNPLYVGARATAGFLSPFEGALDEVAVWDKELSAAEVATVFNGGIAGDLKDVGAPSNLVSWWNMGENISGSTIPDQQSSNDLTTVNSPTVQDDAPGIDQYQSTYLAPPYFPLYTWQQDTFPQDAYDSVYLAPPYFPLYTWQQTWNFLPITWYRMRGIDQTCPEVQQPAYVHWTVQDEPDWLAALLLPGDLPCGSDPSTDVVNIDIAGKWWV